MMQNFPLEWPPGWPRTDANRRTYGRFGKRDTSGSYRPLRNLTVADGVSRVLEEMDRIGARGVVISTNLQTRNDGLPRSGQRAPDDPGVAVYWRDRKNAERCIAVDRYASIADNLAAIAATLDSMRAIERHGGAEILDRAFTGFVAMLPGPAATPWHEILGVEQDASVYMVEMRYRKLRGLYHPDRPDGNADEFRAVQHAWDAFRIERNLA